MICRYCKTENEEQKIRCTFCGADLTAPNRPTVREFVDVTDVITTDLNEKMTYHTYDLLEMLKIARTERSEAYNMLRIVLKSSNEVEVDEDLKNSVEDQYRTFTAHVNVIQEILVDRIGYYPKRVDDKLLAKYLAKCRTSKD